MNILHPLNEDNSVEILKLPPRTYTELPEKIRHKAGLKTERTTHCSKWRIPNEDNEYEEWYVYEGDYYEYVGRSVPSGRASRLPLAAVIACLILHLAAMCISSAFSTVKAVEFFEAGALASMCALVLFMRHNRKISGLMTIYEYRMGAEYYRISLSFSAAFAVCSPAVMAAFLVISKTALRAPELVTLLIEAAVAVPLALMFLSERRCRIRLISNDHEMPEGSRRV